MDRHGPSPSHSLGRRVLLDKELLDWLIKEKTTLRRGGMRSVGRRFCYFLQASLTRRALCLLALVTLTLLFASPEQVHGHSTTQPGLYNADCPFAAIAARDGQASLPSSPPAVSTACAARLIAIVAQTDLSTRVPLHSEFRAPPLS